MGPRSAERWTPRPRGATSARRHRARGSATLSTADRYRVFAEFEAVDAPVYRTLTAGIADDDELLSVLDALTEREQQPNLVLAAVNHLGGIVPDYGSFRSFVFEHLDDVLALVRSRRTQTNEIGRCATLLPALGMLPQPLALIEVGASAGAILLGRDGTEPLAFTHPHGRWIEWLG